MNVARIIVWILVVMVIMSVGIGGCRMLVAFGPTAPKSPPEQRVEKVEVVEARKVTVDVELPTQGEVEAIRSTQMSAEVGGRILEVDPRFEAGETFAAGDLFLALDAADYRALLANAEATLADARVALQTEEARADQAVRDWEKLGLNRDPTDLVLRKPQLASARARISAAEAAVEKAMRDLERTEIRAPYDCRIERTMVDLGAVVAPGMPLVEVVSLGPVQVRLPLSLEDYGYLQRGPDGQVTGTVTVSARIGGQERTWAGRLVRSEEIVDSDTQSVRVVAEFGRDGAAAPPVGVFVEAVIAGRPVEDVVVVQRAAMASPGEVFVVNGDGRLEFRKVTVVRTEAESVLVSGGLAAGDRIITTALSTPVNNMPVQVVTPDQPVEAAGTPPLADEPSL